MQAKVDRMTRENIKNICLVRLSAIGDVTLCLPIVNSIRRSIPDSKITWITSPSSYSLLEGIENTIGVEFIIFNKGIGPKAYLDLQRKLNGRKFDCLLALQASWRANLIYPIINAPIKIGFDKMRAKDCQFLFVNKRIEFEPNQHLLDSYLSFLKLIGIEDNSIAWNLPIDEERRWANVLIGSINSKVLLINPAASKRERVWRTDRYIEVIMEAQKRWNLHILLTGGNNLEEIKIGNIIENAVKIGITNLIGQTSIKQLAALAEKVDAVLSPDTAAVHFAAAFRTPVIGLYAVAPPEITGPYINGDLVVNKFPEAVKRFLKKDPLNLKWGTRVHTKGAMDLIPVNEALEKIERVFA